MNHQVIAVLKIDGVPTDVIWYEGPSLAKAIVAVGQAATRDDDERTDTVSVNLTIGA